MNHLEFIKMDGIGNSFVVIDLRDKDLKIPEQLIVKIANKDRGVGCDQVMLIKNSQVADVAIEIYNQDGTRSSMCGNGLRCIAKYLIRNIAHKKIAIEIDGEVFKGEKADDKISVNLGVPKIDTSKAAVKFGKFSGGLIVNIGNPHIVFFEKDIDSIDLKSMGPAIENNVLFQNRINVNFAQVIDKNTIKLRVWERGAGETLSCGSGATATAYAAFHEGLTGPSVTILFKHGKLLINILKDGSVEMRGGATIEYEGIFDYA